MQVSKALKIISPAYINHLHTTRQVSVSLSLATKIPNRQTACYSQPVVRLVISGSFSPINPRLKFPTSFFSSWLPLSKSWPIIVPAAAKATKKNKDRIPEPFILPGFWSGVEYSVMISLARKGGCVVSLNSKVPQRCTHDIQGIYTISIWYTLKFMRWLGQIAPRNLHVHTSVLR